MAVTTTIELLPCEAEAGCTMIACDGMHGRTYFHTAIGSDEATTMLYQLFEQMVTLKHGESYAVGVLTRGFGREAHGKEKQEG